MTKQTQLEELKKICKEGKEEAYLKDFIICCGYKGYGGDMKENEKCKRMRILSSK